MCHVSRVMCHMSRVICHILNVTCHMSHVNFFFLQSGEAYCWRVCFQRGLPRLVQEQSAKKKRFYIQKWYTTQFQTCVPIFPCSLVSQSQGGAKV